MNARSFTLPIISTLALTLLPSAGAVTGCTDAWLTGSYGMHFLGKTAPAVATGVAGVEMPSKLTESALQLSQEGKDSSASAVGIARLKFDGYGNISGYSGINLQGSWLQANISGRYTVDAECTASLSFTSAAGTVQNFSAVIAGQGDSVFFIQTDAGTGVSGLLKKVRGFCQIEDLRGSYGFQYAGARIGEIENPVSSAGVLTLDGLGGAKLVESRYTSGSSAQSISNGTITILPDCSAVLVLSSQDAARAMNFFALITNDTKQLLIVQSDEGVAVKGIAVAQ